MNKIGLMNKMTNLFQHHINPKFQSFTVSLMHSDPFTSLLFVYNYK